MSIAEFPGSYRPDDERSADPGRVPPQDDNAEQSVLGAMMLSKDAIADVVEAIRGADFYRPAHELIYEAILDLYGRGEPADAITVSAELTRSGDLARVGGAVYLHTLVASVPVTANAGYYAEIVREKAILRRLVAAGTKIVQLGYAGEGNVDDVVDRAQAEVYTVTDRRSSEDYAPLADLMELTIDELEAIGNRDGAMAGVPTGFAELDDLTNGLHPGQMVIVAARPAVGKALALDTPLATPTGWTTMADVRVGDYLLGDDGRPTRVVAATDVMHDRPCYRVEFSDGSTIIADAEHQWRVAEHLHCEGERSLSPRDRSRSRQVLVDIVRQHAAIAIEDQRSGNHGAIMATRELVSTLRCADGRAKHAIETTAPLELPEVDLPTAPYILGSWLAADDGDRARDTRGPSCAGLRSLGVQGSKHIPAQYLRASEGQRRALLAGLLDTDGTVTAGGSVQFCVTNARLASDVYELVVSLGYKCSLTTRAVKGRSPATSTAYLLCFSTSDQVFNLRRKQLVHEQRRRGTDRITRRYVTAVEPIDSVPVRCVQVDNASHMYLAGRSMVPTHNSTLGLDIARSASIRHGLTSVIFSLEMSRTEITMRLLSAEGRIPLHHMRTGKMSDDDWNKLVRKMGEVSEAPLFIDDSPNLTMMEIRAKARRLKQRHDLRLVVVDYLQLMTSGRKVESRQVEVSEFSRQIKLLAKELDVPVVAIAQLNRGSEQRTSKRPMLSDLRESGSLEQDADVVVLLHREDMYEKESSRPGEADLIVAKNRNGPTKDLVLAFQGHYSRFVDMAQG